MMHKTKSNFFAQCTGMHVLFCLFEYQIVNNTVFLLARNNHKLSLKPVIFDHLTSSNDAHHSPAYSIWQYHNVT